MAAYGATVTRGAILPAMKPNITKPFCEVMRVALNAALADALAEVGSKHSVKIALGNATFTPGEDGDIQFKLEVRPVDETGKVGPDRKEKAQILALQSYGEMDGVHPELLAGKSFKAPSGKVFKLYAYRTGRTDKPYIVEEVSTGGRFVVTAAVAKVAKPL